MEMEEIARWAYIAFVVIAIVMGLAVGYMAYDAELHWADTTVVDTNGYVTLIMLILGIVIGITSITAKEVTPFLIATIALVVAGVGNVWLPLNIDPIQILYYFADTITRYIVAFAAPAAVIIAIKAVLTMTKEK